MNDHDHERIWLEPSCSGDERYWSNYPADDCPEEGCGTKSTEYVRADLVAALEAENQRLREALAPFAAAADDYCSDWMEDDYHPNWAEFFVCGDFRRARNVLRSTETSHDD